VLAYVAAKSVTGFSIALIEVRYNLRPLFFSASYRMLRPPKLYGEFARGRVAGLVKLRSSAERRIWTKSSPAKEFNPITDA
jgi:hypothetical protein